MKTKPKGSRISALQQETLEGTYVFQNGKNLPFVQIDNATKVA